jgi:hypothetical protein
MKTHTENIKEILKGCGEVGEYETMETKLCPKCERGLSEYLKAVKVELEKMRWLHSELWAKRRIKDCEEAIKLGGDKNGTNE